MTDMFKTMIAVQEQALEQHRQQIALAQRWMSVGQDGVTAQKQSVAAIDAGAKVLKSWLDLWGVKR